MTTPITLEVADGVALIGLSRPDKSNAINLDLARGLRDAVIEVTAMPDVGAAVLFGHGTQFCVGGDLTTFAAAGKPGEFVAELAVTAHQAVLGLRASPVPVISAIQGACAGGGLGLALAADLVVAERTAQFLVAYTAAGLSPDCGVSWILPRLLGRARANDLILTNRKLDGTEAERLGLASRVVEPETACHEAVRIAQSLADGPRDALSRSTHLARQAANTPLDEHLAAEATAIADLVTTQDGREGVTAFLERRRPRFTGIAERNRNP